MATFSVQIQDMVGSFSDETALDTFLMDGAREVMKVLPPDLLELCTTTSDLDASPSTLNLNSSTIGDVISVLRNDGTQWQICRKVPGALSSRVTISGDLMAASKTDPVFYIKSSTLYIYPTPTDSEQAEVTHLGLPTIDASADSAIGNFPNTCEYLVVLYASCKALIRKLNDKSALTDALTDLPYLVLDEITSSLPTFSAPNAFVLPPAPVGADVDFSELGSIETYNAPVISLPSLETINSMNLPTSPPTVSIESDSFSFTATAPTFVPPVMESLDWADTNNWISTEEDSEMLNSRVQEIQAKVAEYSSRLQESVKMFEKEVQIYQTEFNKSAKENEIHHLNNNEKLQTYQADIQKYTQDVTKEIQRWTAEEFNKKFNEWSQRFQGAISEYGTDVQNETAKVTSSLSEYQARVSKALQEYQAETGYDVTKYSAEVQANVQKYNLDLTQNSTEFTNDLAKYQAEIGEVGQNNQSKIGAYQADIGNYGARIQKYQTDYQWLYGQWQSLSQEYSRGLQLMAGPSQPQPQGDR